MKIKKLFKKYGNAMAIAISTTSFILLTTVGVSTVIISSGKNAKSTESSNNAFLSAESGVENALYEVSFHSLGYEVTNKKEADDHARVNLQDIADSESYWEVRSRTAVDQADARSSTDLYIPTQTTTTASEDVNWGVAKFGTTKKFKLYTDDTSCTVTNDSKDCDYVVMP